MRTFNLYAPNGLPLPYPYYTKWGNNSVFVVCNPDDKISEGDVIISAIVSKNVNGEEIYSHVEIPQIVNKIVSTQLSNGVHKVKFKPIFMKLETENYVQSTK